MSPKQRILYAILMLSICVGTTTFIVMTSAKDIPFSIYIGGFVAGATIWELIGSLVKVWANNMFERLTGARFVA